MKHAPDDLAENEQNKDNFPRTLVVGDLSRWRKEGRDVVGFESLTYVELAMLTPALLSDFKPEIILSPLVADTFDAADVAVKLQELGYTGRYRALTIVAKDSKLVSAEIVALAPDLDFDVLIVK